MTSWNSRKTIDKLNLSTVNITGWTYNVGMETEFMDQPAAPAAISPMAFDFARPKRGISSARQYAVSLFCGAMPDMEPGRVAFMLSHLKDVGELHHFFKDCSSKRNFAAYFMWALKPDRK